MMAISDYLQKLVELKNDLINNLRTKGVVVDDTEKYNTLVSKVLDASSESSLKKLFDLMGSTEEMFLESDITSFEGIFEYTDTSNVTNMAKMFQKSALVTAPLFDMSKVTNMSYMFYWCESLSKIPAYDTSNVTNMSHTFCGCKSVTNLPVLNTSNVVDMSYAFNSMASLTKFPLLDTSNVVDMQYCFMGNDKLAVIPELDVRNVTNFSKAFDLDNSVWTECWIKNISSNCVIFTANDYGGVGNNLSKECLIHIIQHLIDKDKSLTLTIGTKNINKLNTTYVKCIDITDEMREADDLIDYKYPFEICTSGSTGAMKLTTEYAALKGWTIK